MRGRPSQPVAVFPDPMAPLGPGGSYGSGTAAKPDEFAILTRVHKAVSRCRAHASLLEELAGAFDGALPAEWIALKVFEPANPATTICPLPGARTRNPAAVPLTSILESVARDRCTLLLSSSEQVRELFPEACRQLLDAGVRSLVAIPLLVDGRCVGALALASAAEHVWHCYSARLLDAIGNSVAAALDNSLALQQAEGSGHELQALLDVNVAVRRHLERDELFGALAGCLENLLEIDRFGIELPIEGDRLQGHLLTPNRGSPQPTRVKILPAAGTACNWVLQNRQWLVSSTREELRQRFPLTFDVMSREGVESLCAMPLVVGEHPRGVMFFMAARKAAYGNLRREIFDRVASAAAVALDNCLTYEEVRRLRDRLAAENVYLQDEIRFRHNPDDVVGQSLALEAVLTKMERVSTTDSTVLISGETGTGKELVARVLHAKSQRGNRPLIKVNCAALPSGLVESELFGHEKGAFTGALTKRTGRFELASGGTIFLDEVGEMPLETQTKLLRVLQEREFERVGGAVPIKVDVRVIAATNRDLWKAVEEGSFRRDLFYRLNVFPIHLPPLRERREDIPLLAGYLVDRLSRRIGRKITSISKESIDRLAGYSWPGNVRELENILERAVVYSHEETLEISPEFLSLPAELVASPAAAGPSSDLQSVERAHIVNVLNACSWVVEGQQGAAKVLGMHPNTLRSRFKKLGIERPSHGAT